MALLDIVVVVRMSLLLSMLLHGGCVVNADASSSSTTTSSTTTITNHQLSDASVLQYKKIQEQYTIDNLISILSLSSNHNNNHNNNDGNTNRIYPKRHRDEAAVIEWGNSAIISAIDASVAYFGPQTYDAAVFEVESKPILADPIHGIHTTITSSDKDNDNEDENEIITTVSILNNADMVHGNVAVMTDTATTMNPIGINTSSTNGNKNETTTLIDCLDLAIIAQNSKAVALIIVHVNEEYPDNAPRCSIPIGREIDAQSIDIPVVTVSLASIDVLTSATITDDTKQEDIINHGMPERIRLYAGGERPFFEDIESNEPTVYMIHNLLTVSECNSIIEQANHMKFHPINNNNNNNNMNTADTTTTKSTSSTKSSTTTNSLLHYMIDSSSFYNTDRALLYPGFFQSIAMKQIEERIEQVTGFPTIHYSEWIIDRITINNNSSSSTWLPHYDILYGNIIPHATITVFLNDLSSYSNIDGGHIVYPMISNKSKGKSSKNNNNNNNSPPIQIRPVQGLAVVHHNTNDKLQFDINSIHALLPLTKRNKSDDTNENDNDDKELPYLYIARKYILPIPISKIRRYVLPMYILLFGSSSTSNQSIIMKLLNHCHILLLQSFGIENGTLYFDYILIGIPIVIIILILLLLGQQIYQHIQKQQHNSTSSTIKVNKTNSQKTMTTTTKSSTSSSSSSSKSVQQQKNNTNNKATKSNTTTTTTSKKNHPNSKKKN